MPNRTFSVNLAVQNSMLREFVATATAADSLGGSLVKVEAATRRVGASSSSLRGMSTALGEAQKRAEGARGAYEGLSAASSALLKAGGGAAVGIGLGVKAFADFDKSMSAVQANTGATGATLDALREKAIELGSDTQYSGKEAADGINELAKAGLAAKDILNGGLKGALSLAAAGQMEVSDAAESIATAIAQFNLAGNQATHVADNLAIGANTASGSVADLSMGLKQVGVVAKMQGLSFDETTAALTGMAKAGLLGSDAGTSLKSMLQNLNPKTDAARTAMEELGIAAYDSQGNFVGLEALAGQLQAGLGGLSEQQKSTYLTTMFGADGIRAATLIMDQGADGVRRLMQAQKDGAGAAAEMGRALTDNLAGDLERFRGAIDGVVLKSGGGLNNFFRDAAQFATHLVEVLDAVPGPVLQVGAGVATLATAATLGAGAVGKLAPAFAGAKAGASSLVASLRETAVAASTSQAWTDAHAARLKAASDAQTAFGLSAQRAVAPSAGLAAALGRMPAPMGALAPAASATATAVGAMPARFTAASVAMGAMRTAGAGVLGILGGPWGLALAGATAALGFFIQKNLETKEAVGAFEESIKNAQFNLASTDLTKNVVDALAKDGLLEKIKATGTSMETVTQAVMGNDAAWKTLTATWDQGEQTIIGLDGSVTTVESSSQTLLHAVAGVRENFASAYAAALTYRDALAQAGGTTEQMAAAQDVVASAAQTLATKIGGLPPAYRDTFTASLAASDAMKDFADSTNAAGVNAKLLDAAVQALNGGFLDADAAADAGQKAIDALTESVKKNGTSFDYTANSTKKARDAAMANRDAMRGVIQAHDSEISAAAKAGGSQSQLIAINAKYRTALSTVAKQTGISASETRRYTDYLNRVPNEIRTNVAINGVSKAQSQVDQLLGKLNGLQRKAFNVAIRVAASGPLGLLSQATANADGGIMPRRYANGGVDSRGRRVDRKPQVARGGRYVLWAEDETRDEAYISRKRGMEARNRAVLAEAASWFGLATVPLAQTVRAFASGGTTRGATPSPRLATLAPKTGVLTLPVKLVWADDDLKALAADWRAALTGLPSGLSEAAQRVTDSWGRLYEQIKATVGDIPRLNKTLVDAKADIVKAEKAVRDATGKVTAAEKKVRAATNKAQTKAEKEKATKALSSTRGALKSSPAELRTIFLEAEKRYGVSASILAAVAKKESNFNSRAVSRVGAKGIMQLMPGTARSLGVKDPFNARESIMGGAKYLAQLKKMYGGDITKMLAGYNAGPGNVKSGKWKSFKETTNYVNKITADAGVQYELNTGKRQSANHSSAAAQGAKMGKAVATQAAKGGAAMKRAIASAAKGNTLAQAFVQTAMSQRGDRYVLGAHPDGDITNPAAFDCSGLVLWALEKSTGKELKNTNAAGIGKSMGKRIDMATAMRTPGAVFVRTSTAAKGTSGHVAISTGDGKTIEAMGRKYGVKQGKAKGRFDYAIWPTALGPMPTGAQSPVTTGSAPYTPDLSGVTSAKEGLADKKTALTEAQKAKALAEKDLKDAQARKAATDKLLAFMQKQQGPMIKLQEAYDANAEALKDATADLATLQNTFDDLANKVTNSAANSADLSTLWKRDETFDELPSLSEMVDARKKTARDAKAFQAQIDALKAAGLNDSDLLDIINRGYENEASLAAAILQGGPPAIAALNETRDTVTKATEDLGQTAAKSMYDAGLKTGQALVDGLASTKAALETQINAIATQIETAKNAILQLQAMTGAAAANGVGAVATAPPAQKAAVTAPMAQSITVNLPKTITLADSKGELKASMTTVATTAAKTVQASTARTATWK